MFVRVFECWGAVGRPVAEHDFGGCTARPFADDGHRPELVTRYEGLYARGAYVPSWYSRMLAERVAPLLAKYGLGRAGTRSLSEAASPLGSGSEQPVRSAVPSAPEFTLF